MGRCPKTEKKMQKTPKTSKSLKKMQKLQKPPGHYGALWAMGHYPKIQKKNAKNAKNIRNHQRRKMSKPSGAVLGSIQKHPKTDANQQSCGTMWGDVFFQKNQDKIKQVSLLLLWKLKLSSESAWALLWTMGCNQKQQKHTCLPLFVKVTVLWKICAVTRGIMEYYGALSATLKRISL